MDRLGSSASMRELRNQVALDFKRSGSLPNPLSTRSLSDDEERELEGKAGDSGSACIHDSSSIRELKIQEALDFRRSGSSRSAFPTMSLSDDEERELEGKARNSGSARVHDSGMLEDGHSSGNFSMRTPSAVSSGSTAPGAKAPDHEHVVPISRTAPSSRSFQQASQEKMYNSLEFVCILAYLTTFGILGVIIRYLSEVLFGPHVAKLTSSTSALFTDLPANMLGSFFMGWVGVVFKKDIAMFSEHLAIGLSTGLMGSITTYASMMQRMLAIIVAGRVVPGLFGLLAGVYLAQMSLVVGVDSAQLLLRILQDVNHERVCKGLKKLEGPSPETLNRRRLGFVLFAFLGGGLWLASGVLTFVDENSTSRRTLWLACVVAPPGVWIRWYFAHLNGRGIGHKHRLRWLPIGTFLVNVTASSLEAGLSCLEIAANHYTTTLLVGSIQLGTLGCMSTVSTFVAEIQIMHQGRNWWRAYAYPFLSIIVSLVIGLLVYGVPVWSLSYDPSN